MHYYIRLKQIGINEITYKKRKVIPEVVELFKKT